ncbi:MAG: isochorismate synthase, partial [Maribacter sp.]
MSAELLARSKTHLEKELPFVLYSKPREFVLNAIFQADDTIHKVRDYTEQGFVFAPFLNDEKPILLKSEEVCQAPLEFTSDKTADVNQDIPSDFDEEARYSTLVEKAILEIRAGNYKKIVLSRNFKVPFSKPIFTTF